MGNQGICSHYFYCVYYVDNPDDDELQRILIKNIVDFAVKKGKGKIYLKMSSNGAFWPVGNIAMIHSLADDHKPTNVKATQFLSGQRSNASKKMCF